MKTRAIIIALLLAVFTAASAYALTPAGTVIPNSARVSYEDAGGIIYNAGSNTVTTTVAQVCGIDILPDGTAASPGQVLYSFFPSRTVSIPYTLRNSGNGTGSYTLNVANLPGDDADLNVTGVYVDSNQNGLYDTGEAIYDSLAPPILTAGQTLHVVVAGDVTGPVFDGRILINLEGASVTCPAITDTNNVGAVDVSSDGNITANKTLTSIGTSYTPGDTVSFRIDFNSLGLNYVKGYPVAGCDFNADGVAETREGLLVSDSIPVYTGYLPGSASGTPITGFPVYAGADGLWKMNSASVTGAVAEVGFFIPEDASGNVLAPSQYGYLSFSVTVQPTAPAAASSNTATLYYANNSGNVTVITNTVYFDILPLAAIAVDDTDDGGASTGSGVYPDPDDLMDIDHVASGCWVSFLDETWNLGNGPDVVNLTHEPALSQNMPPSAIVNFRRTDGTALPDADGNGIPDTGTLAPGQRAEFLTMVYIPLDPTASGALPATGLKGRPQMGSASVANLVAAVLGTSSVDPTVSERTFCRITSADPVQIQVQVAVTVLAGISDRPLDRQRVVAYEYDATGNLVKSKVFVTDANGIMLYDETGSVYPLYNYMRDGYSYRLALPDEIGGSTYYLSPSFFKSDFTMVSVPGDTFYRDEIAVTVRPDGTKLLMAPLDPAGYVYDENSGAKVDGACVRFYRCSDPTCSTYALVDPALLDLYPDGVSAHENPQVSGPTDGAGAVVGKGAGAFEFRYKSYLPAYDGWYFADVDFTCGLAASDPALGLTYSPVTMNSSGIWDPLTLQPYRGELFYIDGTFPEAVLMRIPLRSSGFRPLDVDKTAGASVVSIGDVVPFTIGVTNPNASGTIYSVTMYDTLPPGLRYMVGSATVDGVNAEPAISPDGRLLTWAVGGVAAGQRIVIRFNTYVIPEGGTGTRVNAADASGWFDAGLTVPVGSNTATAAVVIKKGVFTDKGYIVGKVFIDDNDNRVQDGNEPGIKGVKVYMEDGRYVVTDADGKYHLDNVLPGSHVLKVDTTTLPKNAVLALINNRNLDDPGSSFVDLLPGEIFKTNFRVGRARPDASADAEVSVQTATVTVRRSIDTVLADPVSGTLTLRHELVIENAAELPVFELMYVERTPLVLRDGTTYMDGSPYSGLKSKDGTLTMSLPALEAHGRITVEFITELPSADSKSEGALTYSVKPWGDQQKVTVDVPVSFSSPAPSEYNITVNFGFGEDGLTQFFKDKLKELVGTLRKSDYRKIIVDISGHTDAIRVRPGSDKYRDNLDLSHRRAKAVKDFLASELLDMNKVEVKLDADADADTAQVYSLMLGRLTSDTLDAGIAAIKAKDVPCRVSQEVENFSTRRFTVLSGEFASEAEAAAYAKDKGLKGYEVVAAELKTEAVDTGGEDDPRTLVTNTRSVGSAMPAVPDTTSLEGTKENRRAEVTVHSLSKGSVEAVVESTGTLSRGKYRANFEMSGISGVEQVYGTEIFLLLPDGLSYIGESAALNVEAQERADVPAALEDGKARPDGGKVKLSRKGPFYVAGADTLDRAAAATLTADFLAPVDTPASKPAYVVLSRTASGRVVELVSNADSAMAAKARAFYDAPAATPVAANPAYGILSPVSNSVQTATVTDVKLAVQMNAGFELAVNGVAVASENIGESATDTARSRKTVSYYGVQLDRGENRLTLTCNGQLTDEKIILVTGEPAGISWEILPERPQADGRSPMYVVVKLLDIDGQQVKANSKVEVSVDKGDIYDYETGAFKSGTGGGFTVKAEAGRAVIKLSPSSETVTRKITVKLGDDIEEEVDARFYPERRPWIVAGAFDLGIGFNDTKGSPSDVSDAPFDHSDGDFDTQAGGGMFAKGSVGDYTMSFRYKVKPDGEDTLMKENTPSTEEDQFYPVYGDESEQYFEARSKDRFYAKVENGPSSLLFGDYQTMFGQGLEFNRYDRTFNGGLIHLESEDDYLLRSFVTRNKQSIVRESQKGRGISGPYFLGNNTLVEFSERVWIEVRDRFNNNIILDKRQLRRYADYTISYDDGWIIFKEPVREFDDSFNPALIQVVYETANLPGYNMMYGARAEKAFMGGGIRIGASGVHEDNMVNDVSIIGADMTAKFGGIEAVAEFATTENFDQTTLAPASGSAGRVEVFYKEGDNFVKAYYKKVTEGFQNPSSTNADTGYQTYGASGRVALADGGTQAGAEFIAEDRAGTGRKQSSAMVEQKLAKNLRASARVRWNREKSASSSVENILAVLGLNYSPFEKVSINVGREQVVYGSNSSEFYPTKTIAGITYSVSSDVSAYVQAELQEREEGNTLVTLAGVDAKLTENTTAYSKYSLDDSVSGWRNRAHLGLNHTFIISDGFNIDAGAESVTTVAGDADPSDDYTAVRAGFNYLQKDLYKLTGRYELRLGRSSADHLFNLGGCLKLDTANTLLVTERFFDSVYAENDLLLGWAYRPVEDDTLNSLFSLRWKFRDGVTSASKYILSTHVNYQPVQPVDLMGECALKYMTVTGSKGSTTWLLRGRALWDVTDRFDIGLHAGILRHEQTATQAYSYGPEVGVRVMKNAWVSLGYNFDGFSDSDFGDATSWAKGPYVTFRVKFDENTLGL